MVKSAQNQETNNVDNNTDTNVETNTAPITIRAQYIKDLSFESPNPLRSFTAQAETAPNISINIQARANSLGNNNFEVVLEFHAEAKQGEDVMFVAELSYAGIVTIGNLIPEEHIRPMIMIDCPHLLFPFARNIISDLTRDGGFTPLYLSPIDFASLYNQQETAGN
ncbi:MAG: protein-export chaperone SecB [Alphaproteobacteria bacterium]